ncbi:hypothetical protein XOCgx_3963 [Xanthomonas oryzae pv. oryzicola]|nr:hypothetical protein XOCgx_3963 [Xanthomonas oryzae pv. oryzicola]
MGADGALSTAVDARYMPIPSTGRARPAVSTVVLLAALSRAQTLGDFDILSPRAVLAGLHSPSRHCRNRERGTEDAAQRQIFVGANRTVTSSL